MIYELSRICRLALETGKKDTLERVDKLSRPRLGEKLKLIWNWTVFDWGKGKEGYGEIENDRVQTKPPSKAFPSISWKNGKLVYGDLPEADMGCSIAMTLVLDKKVNIQNPAKMDTGPNHRIAFGQRADDSLIVVTEENISTRDLAQKMFDLGCVNAFQGDCGDSVGVYDGTLKDHGRAIAGAIAAYGRDDIMYTVVRDIQLSKNFKLSEFCCNDDSGKVLYSPRQIDLLQKLRDLCGKPIQIVSAYRTPEYNKKVGGAPQSKHMEGIATDIKVSGITPLQVAKFAEKVGFTGIGVYTHDGNNFTHIDIRPAKSYWMDAPGHKLISVKSLNEIK